MRGVFVGGAVRCGAPRLEFVLYLAQEHSVRAREVDREIGAGTSRPCKALNRGVLDAHCVPDSHGDLAFGRLEALAIWAVIRTQVAIDTHGRQTLAGVEANNAAAKSTVPERTAIDSSLFDRC
jgi:hypothetical protein